MRFMYRYRLGPETGEGLQQVSRVNIEVKPIKSRRINLFSKWQNQLLSNSLKDDNGLTWSSLGAVLSSNMDLTSLCILSDPCL